MEHGDLRAQEFRGVKCKFQLGHRIMHLSQDGGVSDFYITPWEQLCYKRNGKLCFDSFVYQPAEAPKIVLKGSQVHLGDEGGEPVIKGQSFLSLFATHIHTVAPVVGGPTSPPIPQGEMSTLSTTVKTI